LWAAGIFVLGQLGAGFLLDYVYPRVRFPLAVSTVDDVLKDPIAPNVVFLGSSRTGAAAKPPGANRILDEHHSKLHVAAAPVLAGDAMSEEFVFEELLRRGIHPRWIVAEVSPETLTANLPFMREDAARMLKWEDVPEHLPAIIRARAGWIFLEARLVPLSTHRRELTRQGKRALAYSTTVAASPPGPGSVAPAVPGRPGPDPAPAAPNIAAPPTGSTNSDDLLQASRDGASTEVRRWLKHYHLGGLAPAALERLLQRCRDEKIGVILLSIPACSAHRAEFTPEIEAEYRTYLDRLVNEYGCRHVDARDWVPDTLFEDALHVAAGEGANTFTRRFTREVLLKLPAD
jgi:hypothetical protein